MKKETNIGYIIFLFIILSIIGGILEILYMLVVRNKFVIGGFFHVPLRPIYGFGGLLLYILPINLKKNDFILFMSSFVVCSIFEYISSKISKDKKWNYIYHIGQYLPNWHPWENYKDFFVGDKRTNGCREILAIELPWLESAFGEIESTTSVSDKITDLNIGYNDNYMIQISHMNGNKGTLVVDVVSPVAVRNLEVYAENAYLSWNGTPDSIREFNQQTKKIENVNLSEAAEHKEGYSAFIVENAYKNEIREFFDVVLKNKMPLYGFEEDKKILNIIDSMGA